MALSGYQVSAATAVAGPSPLAALFFCHLSSYQGVGGLFDYVNETGTRTQVKGMPTNKKQTQTQPDVTSDHTAHFQCDCSLAPTPEVQEK